MICPKCKVDLGEEYLRCPLCSGQAVDSPPALAHQHTAEYPDVVYRPYRKPYTLFAAVIYVILCAAGAGIEYFTAKRFSDAAIAVFLLPCVWSVFIRPFAVKHRRLGNYLVYDAFYLILFSVYLSITFLSSPNFAISAVIPQICAVGSSILLFHSLFRPKSSRGDIIYAVCFTVLNLGLTVYSLFLIPASYTAVPCFAACALTLLMIRSLSKEDFTDELKARFHS